MIHKFLSKQFLLFLVTGGFAAVVNFCSRFIFDVWFSFSTAIILAYLCGMLTAFVLAKKFVFRQSEQKLSQSIFYFSAVNVAAVLQTWLISMSLAYYFFPKIGLTFFSHEIAHAIGIIVPVFTSYLGHKRFSFRELK